MPCEEFQGALIDLAAGGDCAEVSGAALAHVAACAECRASLERERSLFAAMDAGVRELANAEVPTAWVRSVEMRIAKEVAPNRAGQLRWAYVGAIAAGVLIVMLPALRSRNATRPVGTEGQVSSAAPQQNMLTAQIVAPGATRTRTELRAQRHARALKTASEALPVPDESLVVLVPAEEKAAFAKFVHQVAADHEVAAAMVNPAPETRAPFLQVEPLNLARLEIQRLEDDAATTNAGRSER
jgi:hypothetical protein